MADESMSDAQDRAHKRSLAADEQACRFCGALLATHPQPPCKSLSDRFAARPPGGFGHGATEK